MIADSVALCSNRIKGIKVTFRLVDLATVVGHQGGGQDTIRGVDRTPSWGWTGHHQGGGQDTIRGVEPRLWVMLALRDGTRTYIPTLLTITTWAYARISQDHSTPTCTDV